MRVSRLPTVGCHFARGSSQGNQARKRKKRHLDWKGKVKNIPTLKCHDLEHRNIGKSTDNY
jgi:hypothetical protein